METHDLFGPWTSERKPFVQVLLLLCGSEAKRWCEGLKPERGKVGSVPTVPLLCAGWIPLGHCLLTPHDTYFDCGGLIQL